MTLAKKKKLKGKRKKNLAAPIMRRRDPGSFHGQSDTRRQGQAVVITGLVLKHWS